MKLYSIGSARGVSDSIVARVARNTQPPIDERKQHVLFWDRHEYPDAQGYAAIVTTVQPAEWRAETPVVQVGTSLEYLTDGDVIAVDRGGHIRTLYRRSSRHNFILLTEQCNSNCLMCSQPPRAIDDSSRVPEHLRLLDLIDPETEELGITGGEPTLFGDDFLNVVRRCKEKLPRTALHVLTNGRLFYYRDFARALGELCHPNLVLGIPIYSDVDSEHDYVVQAKGAFEETVLGLHNLAQHGVAVEIRVVVHRQTYRRLPQIAAFIARNFPFAVHIALMGLEMVGLVHKNMDTVWVDPYDYRSQLQEATEMLFLAGMNVSIYNHQLCILPRDIWRFSRKSISDWKNTYLDECNECSVKNACGGFFQSATRKHSVHIKALNWQG